MWFFLVFQWYKLHSSFMVSLASVVTKVMPLNVLMLCYQNNGYFPSKTLLCKLKPELHIISLQKWNLMLWFNPGRQTSLHTCSLTPPQWHGENNEKGKSEKTCLWFLPLPPLVLVAAVLQNRAPLLLLPPALSDTLWSNLLVSGCQSRWLWFYPRKHLNPTHSLTSLQWAGRENW